MNQTALNTCVGALETIDFVRAYLEGAACAMDERNGYPRNLLSVDLVEKAAEMLYAAHERLCKILIVETMDDPVEDARPSGTDSGAVREELMSAMDGCALVMDCRGIGQEARV